MNGQAIDIAKIVNDRSLSDADTLKLLETEIELAETLIEKMIDQGRLTRADDGMIEAVVPDETDD